MKVNFSKEIECIWNPVMKQFILIKAVSWWFGPWFKPIHLVFINKNINLKTPEH